MDAFDATRSDRRTGCGSEKRALMQEGRRGRRWKQGQLVGGSGIEAFGTTHGQGRRTSPWDGLDGSIRINVQQLMHETRTPSHVAIPVLSECTMSGGLYDPTNDAAHPYRFSITYWH